MPHDPVKAALPPIPVILAGGAGKRLFPLSRPEKPKPFMRIFGGKGARRSMFQDTLQRVAYLGAPVIVCGADHYNHVCAQCDEVHITPHSILLEPAARNTAPAIAATAHYIAHRFSHDQMMLTLPADHAIADHAQFMAMIGKAQHALTTHHALITFGIQPTRPATQYGYIERGPAIGPDLFSVKSFTEKPDRHTARAFIKSGHLWNSGMIMGRAQDFLSRIEQEQPDLYKNSYQAVASARRLQSSVALADTSFAACPPLSFDIAILERRKDTLCLSADLEWCDLGTWRHFIPYLFRRKKTPISPLPSQAKNPYL